MAKEPKKTETQDIDALIARLEKQDKEIKELRDAQLDALSRPSGDYAPAPRPQLPPEPELNLDGMPDPLVDKDGYHAEMKRRLKTHQTEMRQYESEVARLTREANAAREPKVSADSLWELYTEDHPAYSKSQAKVRAAAGIAIEKMQKRGIDTMALMERRPAEFFRKVNEVYDAEFGKPKELEAGKEGGGDGDEDDDDEAEGRTAGTFGGVESGGRPGGKAGKPSSSFTQELKEMQDSIWQKPTAA